MRKFGRKVRQKIGDFFAAIGRGLVYIAEAVADFFVAVIFFWE